MVFYRFRVHSSKILGGENFWKNVAINSLSVRSFLSGYCDEN